MTTRQIRIACDGFVISTRPIFDPVDVNDITRIRESILFDVAVLLDYGRVTVWIDEAGTNVVELMGGAR